MPNLALVETKQITLFMPQALYSTLCKHIGSMMAKENKKNNKYFSYIDTNIFSVYTLFALGLRFSEKIMIHFPVGIPPISRNGKHSEFHFRAIQGQRKRKNDFKKTFFAEYRSVPNLVMDYSETHGIPRKEHFFRE